MIDATPQQFAAYRIDSTEVTNAHYAEFLAASPASASQPVECAWNTDFTPEGGQPAQVQCLAERFGQYMKLSPCTSSAVLTGTPP